MRIHSAMCLESMSEVRVSLAPRRRSPLGPLIRLGLVLALTGSMVLAAAVGTNTLGAGDRFQRLTARIELLVNPPPDRPIDDEVVGSRVQPSPLRTLEPTPAGSAESSMPPSGDGSFPSRSPEPEPESTPAPAPVRGPVDFDLLADAGIDPGEPFNSQVENDMCAPASVQIVLAMLGLAGTDDEFQLGLQRRVREWESWRDSHDGKWGPSAIARALGKYGAAGYKVRVYESRADALYDAAVAIRTLRKPVILLAWRGAHTWVMTGYRADADPAVFADATVTGGYILDPWYPRVSSIWGPSDPPGAFQDAAEMQRNYLPWERPEGRYPGRDGKFIAVVPTSPAEGGG